MLQVDPKKRISGSEALQHPWIKRFLTIKDSEIDNKLNSDIISSLRQFRAVSGLKRAALTMLVKMISSQELEILHKEFFKIDKDRTGLISL